jgi:hypothetical protein
MIWVEKLVAAVVVVVAAIAGVNATHVYAGPISYTGAAYTQNFDSLPWISTGQRFGSWSGFVPPGWYVWGAIDLRGSDGTRSPWGPAAVYSFGSSPSDKALGSQLEDLDDMWAPEEISFGVQFVNNTGQQLRQFTLSYMGEQWRNGGLDVSQQLTFTYAINAESLITGDYVGARDLNFVAPVQGGKPMLLDGNLSSNRVALNATITGLEWLPGQSLWLRWTDVNDPGTEDSALAIDDLIFSASSLAAPVETASAGTMKSQEPMSISEPSTGWLAGLCIAALAVVTRFPKKHIAKIEPAPRVLTQ